MTAQLLLPGPQLVFHSAAQCDLSDQPGGRNNAALGQAQHKRRTVFAGFRLRQQVGDISADVPGSLLESAHVPWRRAVSKPHGADNFILEANRNHVDMGAVQGRRIRGLPRFDGCPRGLFPGGIPPPPFDAQPVAAGAVARQRLFNVAEPVGNGYLQRNRAVSLVHRRAGFDQVNELSHNVRQRLDTDGLADGVRCFQCLLFLAWDRRIAHPWPVAVQDPLDVRELALHSAHLPIQLCHDRLERRLDHGDVAIALSQSRAG